MLAGVDTWQHVPYLSHTSQNVPSVGGKVKNQFIGITVLSLVGLAFVFVNPKGTPPQGSKLEKGVKEKVGSPTLIHEGVMTDKQRKHSKIFKRFETVTGGKKLRDIAAETGDVYVVFMVGDGKVTTAFNLQQYLTHLTCEASAVVVARVMSKSSQLIDEGTFTFTDYELTVSEVLKNNAAAPIQLSQTFTYTGPGGAVELNGRVIGAVDYRGEPLQVGEQYLVYLKFIPDTGSYKGFSNDLDGDTFEIKNGTITQASKKPLPLGSKRTANSDEFMAAVRLAANQACGR